MRFIGQVEVAAFVRDHPAETERLQAWVAEMRRRNWRNARDLTAAFREVDASRTPLVIFRFGRPSIHIETLMDFRSKVLILIAIKYPRPHLAQLQHENDRRDH